jgi:spore germination cell wall hydrolase CwlJ-like protein
MMVPASCIPAAQGRPIASAPAAASGAAAAAAPRSARLAYDFAAIAAYEPAPLAHRPRRAGARPFVRPESEDSAARAVNCLTAAVYFEARAEGEEGQRAVAQVVLNRVRHYAYPSSVCRVVFQGPMRSGGGCQFTFTCDGSLRQRIDRGAWERARRIAAAALEGEVVSDLGWATHYHADYVRPAWSRRLEPVSTVGRHVFYAMPGSAGGEAAFVRRSSSLEPAPVRGATALPTGPASLE